MNKTREKVLKGVLEVMLLKLLHDQPMHGYAIILAIKKRTGVYFGPSTIYPLLIKMESEGLVSSQWALDDRPRKVYSVTGQGERTLREETQDVKAIVAPFLEAALVVP
jgi:PadR family transcriptional regulator PadR